jgi:hypothetical protein
VAERPSEQDDNRIPIGEAANHGRLGKGRQEAEAPAVVLKDLREYENRETRNQDSAGKQLHSLKLAQSRAITLIERDCAERFPPFG